MARAPAKKKAAVVKAPVVPVVPPLKRCPDCTIHIQSGTGPHQLAHHACAHIDPARLVAMRLEVLDAISDPTLTQERAVATMRRLCLATAAEAGQSIGDLTALLREMNALGGEAGQSTSTGTAKKRAPKKRGRPSQKEVAGSLLDELADAAADG